MPWLARKRNGSVPAKAKKAPPPATLRMPKRCVSTPTIGYVQIMPSPRGAINQPAALGDSPHIRMR